MDVYSRVDSNVHDTLFSLLSTEDSYVYHILISLSSEDSNNIGICVSHFHFMDVYRR